MNNKRKLSDKAVIALMVLYGIITFIIWTLCMINVNHLRMQGITVTFFYAPALSFIAAFTMTKEECPRGFLNAVMKYLKNFFLNFGGIFTLSLIVLTAAYLLKEAIVGPSRTSFFY